MSILAYNRVKLATFILLMFIRVHSNALPRDQTYFYVFLLHNVMVIYKYSFCIYPQLPEGHPDIATWPMVLLIYNSLCTKIWKEILSLWSLHYILICINDNFYFYLITWSWRCQCITKTITFRLRIWYPSTQLQQFRIHPQCVYCFQSPFFFLDRSYWKERRKCK